MTAWLRYAGRPLKPALSLLRSYMIAPLATDLNGLSARLDRLVAAPAWPADPMPMSMQAPVPETPPAPVATPVDMSLLLHRGRTALLREVPKGAGVFLSAGRAAGWFFEWVEQCYSDIPRHIGLEYYAPSPDTLPANVEWIENTCSDMSGVADAYCDLVFFRQNLEHLWTDEAISFFLEAARVTRTGGLLVMDSPNRSITEALRTWSHPEHTVELTTAEAVAVTELAGFDVVAVQGMWLGCDPNTGAVLPFQHTDAATLSLEEPLVGGVGQPENAFLWWIEARCRPRAGRHRVARTLDGHFSNRLARARSPQHRGRGPCGNRAGRRMGGLAPAASGQLIFGPYMPLRAGRYRCTFELEAGD